MAIGLGVLFFGYTLSYFGYCSLKGEGVGLLDLLVPGREVTIPGSGDPRIVGSGAIGIKGPRGPTGANTGPGGTFPIKGPQGPLGPTQADG